MLQKIAVFVVLVLFTGVFCGHAQGTNAGETIKIDTRKDGKLKKTFATIVEELRFQYRLGFYPPDETGDKTLHDLKVKVSRPETVVRSRGSYRAK